MKTKTLLLSLIALFLLPASANAEVLFDSTPNVAGQHPFVQDYEAARNNFDAEAADDFTVPAGQTWTIQRAFVDGVKVAGTGPGTTNLVNVALYLSNGTLPAATPFFASQLTSDAGTVYPNFDVALPPIAALGPGTYWFGAQARMDAGADPGPYNQWAWGTNTIQRGNPAAFRNPGNGLGTNCVAFTPLNQNCVAAVTNPDFAFRIEGTRTVSPVSVVAPATPVTPVTPVTCKKGQKLKKGKCVKKRRKKK